MIRVLVAEDSATARQVLVDTINGDPGMSVVGVATDGAEAVDRARDLRPSIVTMDIHMPILDGFEATRQIMRESPVPILIVSGSGPDASAASLNALRAGALGIAAKPSAAPSDEGRATRDQLLAQIRALSDVKVVRRVEVGQRSSSAPAFERGTKMPNIRIVALAASTGGPAALARLVAGLPSDLPVPLVAVQHNALGFMPALAKWLNESGNLRVMAAGDGDELLPGVLYIAPDGHHLGVDLRGRCVLDTTAAIGGFRPSATFLFRSVANAYGPNALSVVLSGMGTDGVEGLRLARDAGGTVFAQSEASSVVWGMPGAAVNAGLVDRVVDLGEMAGAITASLGLKR